MLGKALSPLLFLPMLLLGSVTSVVMGRYFYDLLKAATDTGERHAFFEKLIATGAYGRLLARKYARAWFAKNRGYASYWFTNHKPLWVGQPRQKMRTLLGAPDREFGTSDLWLLREESKAKDVCAYLVIKSDEYVVIDVERMLLAEKNLNADLKQAE